MPLTQEAKALALILIEGAVKATKNADELFDEARLLADAGRVARALLLHQISLEECGKAELLYVSLAEHLRGQPVDLKQLARVLARHAPKNRTNAYFMPGTEAELAACARGDFKSAVSAFDDMKEAFHTESNDLKNASLYVDFDGSFKAPSEVITQKQLSEVHDLNGRFMMMAMEKLKLLMRWASDLDAAATEVAAMWATLGLDSLERGNPEAVGVVFKQLEKVLAAFDQKVHALGNPIGESNV